MILLTGSVIMGVLGFAVIHMFAMLFIVIALGGLAAFLMALSWKPGWIRYESIDPEKWKYGSKSNPFGGERGVFEGYEKLKP